MEDPMAHELSNDELKRLARLGAVARLEQLEAERQAILRAFPDLTASAPTTQAAQPAPARLAGAAAPKKRARKRRKMTAEEKKAVSERMTRYWATKKQR
jgi:hypothetical protein